ncbi:MAG: protoporphyrinogen oxidase HemJ [Methylobacterium sp.]
MLYDWIKAGHIVSLIAWMAAMLYLPRLFVYHASLPLGSEAQSATFKIMERRLLKAIMTPAMIATWVFGLILAWMSGYYAAPWLQAKFALVVAMSGIHGWLARMVKDFAADRNTRGHKFYRVINEVPTLLMIVIVVLATVKPGF